MPSTANVERAVIERYSRGADSREAELCCPVDYDPRYLGVIPDEIIERDYGCGDPSRHLAPGEAVLDLGSGAGKIAYIAAQIVGARGRVVGVDLNLDMLALARRHQRRIGDRIGWHNVEFRRARIQDLRLDLERVDEWLERHPIRGVDDLRALEVECSRLRREEPLIPDASVDVVISSCVLNLVGDDDKLRLFPEIHRVLRRGGRVVISDIVADEPVPEPLKADPELWSGCVSGAMTETAFLDAFEQAGFYGVEILNRGDEPWRTIEGIEFRPMTIRAYRGLEGPCLETNKAVIYRGPWRKVIDDDGHVFRRGVRTAVCEKTFAIMTQEPYLDHLEAVLPLEHVEADAEQPFDCQRTSPRHPRETKGLDYDLTSDAAPDACGPNGNCC